MQRKNLISLKLFLIQNPLVNQLDSTWCKTILSRNFSPIMLVLLIFRYKKIDFLCQMCTVKQRPKSLPTCYFTNILSWCVYVIHTGDASWKQNESEMLWNWFNGFSWKLRCFHPNSGFFFFFFSYDSFTCTRAPGSASGNWKYQLELKICVARF